MAKRDYYETLGINNNASADEIKKAYRKLAVQHHPDKQGGDEAKFKELGEAYEVLKDSSKRQRYDQFGHAGVGSAGGGGGYGGNPFEGFQGFGGGGNQGFEFDFGGGGLGDIFGSFFGGGGQGQQQTARGRDVEVEVSLTFEEAIFGKNLKMKLELEDSCEHCKGSTVEPGSSMKVCDTCKGSGRQSRVVNTIFGQIQQDTHCPTCRGKGRVPEKVCTVCKGKGTQRRVQDLSIKVPAGIDDGATIRLREHGEATLDGPKGDLFVHVRVKPHKKFTREGDLILSDEHVNFSDAALGTEIEVETVDGKVRMKVPAGTQSGTDLKLSEHGAPNIRNQKRGPHIVSIIVDTPTRLSKDQKQLFETLRDTKPARGGLFG